jgi:hypothetical protein
MGFEYQEARKADSHYARSDIYMIWRDPGKASRATAKSAGRRRVTNADT